MLPTTTTTTTTSIDEADAANLNAEFVTDNILESGSAEAETNKADDANMKYYEQQQHDDEETALAAELSDELKLVEDGSLLHNEQLTVEDNNNRDENESETADNFNESNDENNDDEATELTKAGQAHREDVSSDEDVVEVDGDVDDETAKLSAELNEETDKDIDAVSAEFDAESISIIQQNQQNEDDDSEDDDERAAVRQSSIKHSNYAANNKQREDVTSSDDENSDSDETASRPIQMHPQFNAEWETLAEDLAAESNDLSNDIDIYEAIAPVDLSNDLAVNDIAASQPGFPINPDAEFIEVDGTTITKPSLLGPKFEKLSLGVGGGAALNSTTSYQQHAKQYSQNFK